MKVLVIGSGGREHALVWKLRRSSRVTKLWCAPGNGGIALDAECLATDAKDVAALADLAQKLAADLTVVGPELPLVLGITDEFEKRGLRIVGPSKAAARLEGSKVFAKQFMERHSIPTAPLYGIHDSAGDAYGALCAVDWPCVIKADGLAAGKGVLVAPDPDTATAFIDQLMEQRQFGDAGARVIMEEALEGKELSYIVLTDGRHIVPLAPTRDHKRALEGNQGPNTGGMGAYSTDSLLSPELEKQIRSTIVEPAIRGLAADGLPYQGFFYFGLMLTAQGPRVLEFNCRLGDPEAQAVIARMDFDLAEALDAVAAGRLEQFQPRWKPGASVCIVMASGGYPGEFETGKPIDGLDAAAKSGAVIFHAGTKREGENFVTTGGRVLGVTATAPSLPEALRTAYDAAGKIRFHRAHFRTDIAKSHAAAAS
ncbi:MAG: phosphoribosylamine--glycine ligase [Candidatus Acidiferrales bacterium]